MSKCEDIIDLHAPLIHKAADIQFQQNYTNGTLPASIIDLPLGKNMQRVFEAYISQLGTPVEEIPIGNIDNNNVVFQSSAEFIPGSLEIFISGDKLDSDEFTVTTTGPLAYKEFTIILYSNNHDKIKYPPFFGESLVIKYNKRIAFNTKGGS